MLSYRIKGLSVTGVDAVVVVVGDVKPLHVIRVIGMSLKKNILITFQSETT